MKLTRVYEDKPHGKSAVWRDEDVAVGQPHAYLYAYEDGEGNVVTVRARFTRYWDDGGVTAIYHDAATKQVHPNTTIEQAIEEVHGYFAVEVL